MNAGFSHHAVGCGRPRKCVLQSPEYRRCDRNVLRLCRDNNIILCAENSVLGDVLLDPFLFAHRLV
jgi:hypothetical protein